MRLGDFERLLDDGPVLIRAVHLSPERLGVDLDLLRSPAYEACRPRASAHLPPRRELDRNSPDAMLLSLYAAMYHSQVFLMSVKVTIASSEINMLMSPSNLICLALLRTSVPRPSRKVSRARSPCPSRSSHAVVRTTPDLRIEWSERS